MVSRTQSYADPAAGADTVGRGPDAGPEISAVTGEGSLASGLDADPPTGAAEALPRTSDIG